MGLTLVWERGAVVELWVASHEHHTGMDNTCVELH